MSVLIVFFKMSQKHGTDSHTGKIRWICVIYRKIFPIRHQSPLTLCGKPDKIIYKVIDLILRLATDPGGRVEAPEGWSFYGRNQRI